MQYTGPTARPSIGSGNRRSARLQTSRGHDTSFDADRTPEKLYPSLDPEKESDHINSSGNESFDKSKSASRKLISTEIHEQTTRTVRNYNYDDGDRIPVGGFHGRGPEPVEYTSLPPKNENSNVWIYLVVLFVIVAVVVGYVSFTPQKTQCPQFKALSEKYARQDPLLWKSLKINIENVLNQTPEQPGVFLLAYNDHDTVEHIMVDIINTTAQCMHSRDPIKLNGRTFANAEMIKDYGVVIQSYRKRLENEGIMYVEDLDETPATVAQAFHTICDTITPLVHKSVIFFTLYVEEATAGASKQIHELVEEKLSHNWDTINHDTLNALIGRVTDQVFFLHSET